MVWGCLTGEGTGELIRIDGNVNTDKYIKILEQGLIKTIEDYDFDAKKVLFMQDGAPAHTAKATLNWLKLQGINKIDWPAQSPDLNPIENLWEIIDKKIRSRDVKPSNANELWNAVSEEWKNIDKSLVRNLYLSMNRRITQVLEKKGGYSKY